MSDETQAPQDNSLPGVYGAVETPELAAAIAQLGEAEKAGYLIPIKAGPMTAFALLGALQLAWAHPDVQKRAGVRRVLEEVAEALTQAFKGNQLLHAHIMEGWQKDAVYTPPRCTLCGLLPLGHLGECIR